MKQRNDGLSFLVLYRVYSLFGLELWLVKQSLWGRWGCYFCFSSRYNWSIWKH